MSYQVIARKWRPQRFEDIVGQEHVTRTLQNAIRSDRLAHAFLFSGVRGVGKTTTARILAKALNCHQGPAAEPCCECVSCKEITAANSVDVLEIDAASNRGIDDIRELRENTRYGTSRDRYKIFIIDEVHMLTTEAFNALLKTLEEPPSHVKFILATTEHHRIPVTITSRCQQYEFKIIPFALILERLRLICNQEGIQVSDTSLRAISRGAQGSLRDGQSSLDQIIAFCGKEIRDEDVQALLGVVGQRRVVALMDAILQRDEKELLERVQELYSSGISAHNFCRNLIEHVRNLLVFRAAGWNPMLLPLPDSEQEDLKRQAALMSEAELIRAYDLLNRVDSELRWHNHPEVHLEMALLKLVQLSRLPALEEVIRRLERGEVSAPLASSSSAKAKQPVMPASAGRRAEEGPSSGNAESGSGQVAEVRPPDLARSGEENQTFETAQNGGASAVAPSPPSDQASNRPPRDVVSRLMAYLQEKEMGLYTPLQHSRIQFADDVLSVHFQESEKFWAAQLREDPERRRKLSLACATITGKEPRIELSVESAQGDSPAEQDPLEEEGVKEFLKEIPGKVRIDRN